MENKEGLPNIDKSGVPQLRAADDGVFFENPFSRWADKNDKHDGIIRHIGDSLSNFSRDVDSFGSGFIHGVGETNSFVSKLLVPKIISDNDLFKKYVTMETNDGYNRHMANASANNKGLFGAGKATEFVAESVFGLGEIKAFSGLKFGEEAAIAGERGLIKTAAKDAVVATEKGAAKTIPQKLFSLTAKGSVLGGVGSLFFGNKDVGSSNKDADNVTDDSINNGEEYLNHIDDEIQEKNNSSSRENDITSTKVNDDELLNQPQTTNDDGSFYSRLLAALKSIRFSITNTSNNIEELSDVFQKSGNKKIKDAIRKERKASKNFIIENKAAMGLGLLSLIVPTIASLGKIKEWFADATKWLEDAGKNIFETLTEGIIPFITKTLPEFFEKNGKKWFGGIGDTISTMLDSFGESVNKMMVASDIIIGDSLTNLANILPAFTPDVIKKALQDLGGSMKTPHLSTEDQGVPISDGSAMSIASQMVGKNENNPSDRKSLQGYMKSAGITWNNPDEAWCASFTNASLQKAGMKTVSGNKKLAREFLNYGQPVTTANAIRGDIVVLKRGNDQSKGHVGFLDGFDGNYVRILAGNTSNEVKYQRYPIKDILGIRRPVKDTSNQSTPIQRVEQQATKKTYKSQIDVLKDSKSKEKSQPTLSPKTISYDFDSSADFVLTPAINIPQTEKNVELEDFFVQPQTLQQPQMRPISYVKPTTQINQSLSIISEISAIDDSVIDQPTFGLEQQLFFT